MDRVERNKMICVYFHLGFTNNEILQCLRNVHRTALSIRQLKRITAQHNLYRRKHKSDLLDVIEFVEDQLTGSGKMHGYRWMHLKCIHRGLFVTQESIRQILLLLDPEGVEMRKKRRLRRRQYNNMGPNHVWHTDGYDKLKPYGICISGCIDGWSRMIIWLRAFRTNKNPQIIAGYYMEAVEEHGGCPMVLRADRGTEHAVVADLQPFNRQDHDDRQAGEKSFMYGRSTANQRIEWYWGLLRRENSQFWMNLFQKLTEDGHFSGDLLDKSVVQYCFMDVIQKELDDVAFVWNTHRIRPSKNQNTVSGRPCLLYIDPEPLGKRDCICEIPNAKLQACKELCLFASDESPCDGDVFALCNEIMEERGMLPPTSPQSAVDNYIILRNEVVTLLLS